MCCDGENGSLVDVGELFWLCDGGLRVEEEAILRCYGGMVVVVVSIELMRC